MKKEIVFLCLLMAVYLAKGQDINLLPQSVIAPPSASQDGSANLDYPIIFPEGLNSMTPVLTVHYNSDGGNSWMGTGWNIGVPAVYLDTRWGVPRFDINKESELYSLFGEQLMYPDEFLPHRHKIIEGQNGEDLYSTVGQNRTAFLTGSGATAIKIFNPRRKETYAKIERIGNTPANYYWKVTNMDGSISWFGGDENGIDDSYVTKAGTNIAFWALKKRVDTHGYFIQYEYQSGTTPTGNLTGGKHLYLKKISYTGLQKINGSSVQTLKQPMYEILFDLDTGTRQDKSISARYGYKDVIINRLNHIKINELYNGTVQIKKYSFTYTYGAFGKTVLKKIDEYKGVDELVFTHSMDYYEPAKATGSNGIFAPTDISAPEISTNMLLGLDDILNVSRLGTTENSGVGGEINLSVGAGLFWQNMSPAGTFANIPLYDIKANFTSGKSTLVDINGDGLLDILYKDSNGKLNFYENTCSDCKKEFKLIYNPASNISYGSSKDLIGVSHFLKGEGTQRAGLINGLWGFSMEYLFWKFGVRNYKSKSLISNYLTDANGDLLPDLVVKQDGNSLVYFNHLDSQGRPTFTTSSQPTENMLIVADIINPEGDAQDEYEEDEPEMGYDAIKVYSYDPSHQLKAFGFTVALNDVNALEEDEEIKVSLEAYDENYTAGSNHIQIFSGKLSQSNPSITFNTDSNHYNIANTHYQYFYRTHYNSVKNPAVIWKVDYTYTDNGSLDGNSGHANEVGSLERNFFLSNNGSYPVKFTGTGTITWPGISLPTPTADDLIMRIVKKTINENGEVVNTQIIYNSSVNHGVTSIPSGSLNFSATYSYNTQTGAMSYNELEFKLISVTNLKWHELNWTPKIEYSGNMNVGGVSQTVEGEYDVIPQHSIYSRSYDEHGQPLDNPYARTMYFNETSLINSSVNGCVGLIKMYNGYNFNEDIDGTIYITIKRDGQFFDRLIISITDGIVSMGAPISLPPGYRYFVIFSTNDDLDENTPGILDKFIEAHSDINYEFFKTCNGILPIANFTTQNGFTYRGPNYIGGGQFFYNPELASSTTPVDAEGDKLIDVNALNTTYLADVLYAILNIGAPEDYETSEEYEQAILDALGLEEGEEIGIDEIDDYLEGNSTIEDLIEFLMTSQSVLPAIPFRKKVGNEYIDKWIGFNEDMYVDKLIARAGKFDVLNGVFNNTGIGEPEPEEYGPQQADLNTGMNAITLYSTGKFKSKRELIWSESEGNNKYSTRFIDLNGDRYPEIIYNNDVYYTTMTGGQKGAVSSVMGGDPLEFVDSNVEGTSIKRGFNKSDMANFMAYVGESLAKGQDNASVRVDVSMEDLDGDIKQEDLWIDINGDGFTDWVKKESNGNYKIHYSLGNTMDTNMVAVNAGYSAPNSSPNESEGISIGGGFGDTLGDSGLSGMISLSIGGSFSKSNVKSQFVDINNDGLMDLVYNDGPNMVVKYNLGNTFTSSYVLGSTDLNANFSSEEYYKDSSAAANITASIVYPWNFIVWFIPVYIKAGVWLMVNGNVTSSEVTKTFKDINGDGFPDLLLDRNSGFKAYNSKMGQAGKLRSVNTSLGTGISLNYVPIGNTYDMPVSKWVLNNVTELKPASDENFAINQFYEYKNGYYDRREREFYGFELVKSFTSPKSLTQANSMSESAFRATIEAETINKYYNKNYYLRGRLKEQYIIKNDHNLALSFTSIPDNRIHSVTQNYYALKPAATDGLIDIDASSLPENYDVGGTEGRGTAAAVLQKTETKLYEYGSTPITTTTEYVFDGYKRLQSQTSTEENIVKEFYYPDELLTEPFMQDLTDEFRINTVVRSVSMEGNVKLLTTESGFNQDALITNDQLRVVSQSVAKGDNPVKIEMTIDRYDDAGHIIQQSTPEGKPVSIIWGYNDRYPVATIEGLGYDELPSSIVSQIRSISSATPGDETALLTQLNALRTHTSVSGKALITAYTYYPNTGVRTVISSNGLKTQYTYYPNGKLKEVIDNNGDVVQEFKYNYFDPNLNN